MDMSNLVTNTGLNLPEDCTHEQHHQVGIALAKIEHGMQWAIGDWYNRIAWGDKEQACVDAGLNYKTAKDMGAIASVFQMSSRNDILSFSHHKTLSIKDLSQDQRNQLLKDAEENKWSGARLKTERNLLLGIEPKAPSVDLSKSIEDAVNTMVDNLPDRPSKKKITADIKKVLTKLSDDLKHDFNSAVDKAVKVERLRLSDLRSEKEAELEKASNMRKQVNGFMTRDEFQLVRSCLHPDKHGGNNRYTKAFDIFNRLEAGVPLAAMSKDMKASQGWD